MSLGKKCIWTQTGTRALLLEISPYPSSVLGGWKHLQRKEVLRTTRRKQGLLCTQTGEAVTDHDDSFYLLLLLSTYGKVIPGFVRLCYFFQNPVDASVSIITSFLCIVRNYGRGPLIRGSCFNQMSVISSIQLIKQSPNYPLISKARFHLSDYVQTKYFKELKKSINEFLWPVSFLRIFHYRAGWAQGRDSKFL